MKDLNEIFNRIVRPDSYQRVDEIHPLDLYIGIDDMFRWTLLLVCDIKPQYLLSSKMIRVKLGQRDDERWTLSLSLVQDEYKDMFLLFCGDIIESSRMIKDKEKGARFIVNRYYEWKQMLADFRKGLLSPKEIKGLLGEMYVLNNELMDKFGPEKAALSWTGPRAAYQDFVVDDTWYEVKTISSGKEEVKISSVEQLDCENKGELVVVFADKTSQTNVNAVNLNLIYIRILSRLADENVRNEFSNMLLKYGYFPRPEYEDSECTFEIKGIQHYQVAAVFPCLRRKDIPTTVTKVDYNISLPAIEMFKVEEEMNYGIK